MGVGGVGPQPPLGAEGGFLGAPHSHPKDLRQGLSRRKLIFVCAFCDYYFTAGVTVSRGDPDLMALEILRGRPGLGRGLPPGT